jgi:hypothetical protein
LTLEVADILDELNMLLLLLETQARVLALLEQKLTQIKPAARDPNTGISVINMGAAVIQGEMHISTSGISHQQVVNLDEAVVGSMRITSGYGAPTSVQTIGGFAGNWLHEALQRLNSETSNLERLRRDATRTHELVSCSTRKKSRADSWNNSLLTPVVAQSTT